MRPFHHAKSSAKRHGVKWEDHLPIHEFIDSTKSSCADLRHRIVLHSTDLGGKIVEEAFPHWNPDILSDIMKSHLIEDMGEVRTLKQWLNLCNLNKIPHVKIAKDFETINSKLQSAVQIAKSVQKLNSDFHVQKIANLLKLPITMKIPEAWQNPAMTILCNCAGL